MKRIAALLLCFLLLFTACAEESSTLFNEGNTVIDGSGAVLKIPENRDGATIASVYAVAVPFIVALDLSDRMLAVNVKSNFWTDNDEHLAAAGSVGRGTVDLELLASYAPDVLIHRSNDNSTVEAVQGKLGIDVMCIRVEDFDDIKETLTMMGNYFGKEERAIEVITWMEGKFDLIDKVVAQIPESERVTALVLGGDHGVVAGGDMLQSWMIEKAGGVCVASEVAENRNWANVGVETILGWNPEFLFCTSSTMLNYSLQSFYTDYAWGAAEAVLKENIYLIPSVIDTWDMPGINCTLGTMYMLNKMYPERFTVAALQKEINEYYQFMFGQTFDSAYLGYNLEANSTTAEAVGTQVFSVFVNGIEVTHETMAEYPLHSIDATSTNTYGTTTTVNYAGYSIADILKAIGLNEKYTWLQCTATDGYSVTLTGDIVMDSTTILAMTSNGETFPFAPWFAPCSSKVSPNYVRAVDSILVNTTEAPPDIAAPTGERISQPTAPEASVPEIAAAAPQDDNNIVLVITGDGVSNETTWTLGQLKAMADGYREYSYSTTNNWPTFDFSTAHGVSLPYLLRQAGILDSAASIKFIASDGYNAVITRDQMFGERYSYTNHSVAGSNGAVIVEPIVAWAWSEGGSARPEAVRPFFGQSGPWEVNTASFVKDLNTIEVSTVSAGVWPSPTASIADGSVVSAGEELELSHPNLDNIRIYYTLDDSEPDYNSAVYNPSTRYFQPQLIVPLELRESLTVKAYAAGYGKDRSPTVTFSYTVK